MFFYFHPYMWKIPILTHSFQRGWFNHQLDQAYINQLFFVLWPLVTTLGLGGGESGTGLLQPLASNG